MGLLDISYLGLVPAHEVWAIIQNLPPHSLSASSTRHISLATTSHYAASAAYCCSGPESPQLHIYPIPVVLQQWVLFSPGVAQSTTMTMLMLVLVY